MTTYKSIKIACWSCNLEADHYVLGSTSAFGASDLDLRPPPLQRDTMYSWIQTCRYCSYTATDISSAPSKPETVREVMRGQRWEKPTAQPASSLALSFMRRALIDDAVGESLRAAESTWCAAWAADDENNESLAIECRLVAARLFQIVLEGTIMSEDNALTIKTRLIDILRRARAWNDARSACDNILSLAPDGIIRDVVIFQKSLIEIHDTSSHTIDKVGSLS